MSLAQPALDPHTFMPRHGSTEASWALAIEAIPDVPVRLRRWCEARGIRTLEAFLSLDPKLFYGVRNIGYKTMLEMDRAVLAATGARLVEHRAAREPGHGASGFPSRWNHVADWLDEDAGAVPLATMSLPARVRRFCDRNGVETVGELFRHRRCALITEHGIGRKSLSTTLHRVAAELPVRLGRPLAQLGGHREG